MVKFKNLNTQLVWPAEEGSEAYKRMKKSKDYKIIDEYKTEVSKFKIDLDNLKYNELQKIAKKNELKANGTKEDLIKRIKNNI